MKNFDYLWQIPLAFGLWIIFIRLLVATVRGDYGQSR